MCQVRNTVAQPFHANDLIDEFHMNTPYQNMHYCAESFICSYCRGYHQSAACPNYKYQNDDFSARSYEFSNVDENFCRENIYSYPYSFEQHNYSDNTQWNTSYDTWSPTSESQPREKETSMREDLLIRYISAIEKRFQILEQRAETLQGALAQIYNIVDMLTKSAQKEDHDIKEWVEDDERQQELEPETKCIDREIQGSMEMNNESEQLLTESEMEEEQQDAPSETIIEDIPEPLSIPTSFQLEVIFDETPIPYILHVKIDCDLTGCEKAKLLRLLKLMNLRRASKLCKADVRNNWRDITFPFDRG